MEHLGEIVESLALARPIADRTQQAERLSQELHRCVGPAQRLVSAPEVVQGPSRPVFIADLPLHCKPFVQVRQCRVQLPSLEPHSTHIRQRDAYGRPSANFAQHRQSLAVVAQRRVALAQALEGQSKVIEACALTRAIFCLTPHRQRLAKIYDRRVMTAQRLIYACEVIQRHALAESILYSPANEKSATEIVEGRVGATERVEGNADVVEDASFTLPIS